MVPWWGGSGRVALSGRPLAPASPTAGSAAAAGTPAVGAPVRGSVCHRRRATAGRPQLGQHAAAQRLPGRGAGAARALLDQDGPQASAAGGALAWRGRRATASSVSRVCPRRTRRTHLLPSAVGTSRSGDPRGRPRCGGHAGASGRRSPRRTTVPSRRSSATIQASPSRRGVPRLADGGAPPQASAAAQAWSATHQAVFWERRRPSEPSTVDRPLTSAHLTWRGGRGVRPLPAQEARLPC